MRFGMLLEGLHVGEERAGTGEGNPLGELLRRAGVRKLEEMPLELEAEIQEHLARAGDAIVPHLSRGLESADPRTRMKVATYLGQVGTPSCEAPLLRGLADPDPRVRLLAVISLRDCGCISSAEPLLAALADPDTRVCGAAADALGVLTNHAHDYNPFDPPDRREAATEHLRRWLDERRGRTREDLLVEGFRDAGYPLDDLATGWSILVEALGAPQPCVRRNAERVLGKLSGVRRTMAQELAEVDPAGHLTYEEARQEALRRLQAFYRRRLEESPP
jgi:hypothetical protein